MTEPEQPEPQQLEPGITDPRDLPLFPSAARKSARRRNNAVMLRPFRRPVYSIAATGRVATRINGSQDLVRAVGWGATMQLRIHFLRVAKARFGVEIYGGHTRFSRQRDYEAFEGNTVTRTTLLTHSDFSAGPSLQIPLGAVFIQFGGSAGIAISGLQRPLSADASEDDLVNDTDFLLRGGLSLGIPILNHHGLTIGAGIQHMFSGREIPLEPGNIDGPTTRPFSAWVEATLGYQIWF